MLEWLEISELAIIAGLVWNVAKAHSRLEFLEMRVQHLELLEQERTAGDLASNE